MGRDALAERFVEQIKVESCDTLFMICGWGECSVCYERKEGQKWHMRYKYSSQRHPVCGDLKCIMRLMRKLKSAVVTVEYMEHRTQQASRTEEMI